MNRMLRIAVICLASCSVSAQTAEVAPKSEIDVEHTQWITQALLSMQKVKVGQRRSQLLEIFTTEGGLSTTSQRIYVYRRCPYIKVDVKFAASSGEEELPTDKIIAISKPYLEGSIND